LAGRALVNNENGDGEKLVSFDRSPIRGRSVISISEQHFCAGSYVLVGSDLASGRLFAVFPDYDVTATHSDTPAWLVYPSRMRSPMKVRVFELDIE